MILGFVIFLNYSGISKGTLNGKNITLAAVFVTKLRDLSSYSVEKRRDHRNLPYAHAKLRGRTANFCDPASSQHYNSGGVHREKNLARQYHS